MFSTISKLQSKGMTRNTSPVSSGDVARSQGMTDIARKTGLGRQALYTALSENGDPTLETLTSVLGALGLELTVQKKAA